MASHRRTLAAVVAVVLASLSLYPVYIGTGWFFAGCGAAMVIALAGTLARLRRLPVVADLIIGVAALLLYLNVTFSNRWSYLHVLPTRASLAALWHIAGQGFDEAAKYAPPVPELRGMVLLGAAGIGIAALLTDLIAVRLGSAALAGLPLLLLFTEPFTLSVSRGFVGTTVAFIAGVAGYLGLLSSEARDRIREWEHNDPSHNDAPDTRPLAATGRRVGSAAVALALFVPLFVPGLHMTRLFGSGHPGIGGNTGGAVVSGFPNPTTQVTQQLTESQAVTELAYATTDNSPGYLQLYVLDQLTDKAGWQLLGQPASHATAGSRLPAPPGLTSFAGVTKETTRITIAQGVGADTYGALPVPFPATTVTAEGTVRADPATLMVFDPGVTLGGLSYTVDSYDESPPASVLDGAGAFPQDIISRDLSVPASYDSLRSLARSVVRQAGAKSEFQDAVALQNWLGQGNFSYTLHAPTFADAAGLTKFLTVTKTGYCLQFSSAMAVLARLLGIPSRVAFGFTAGTTVSNGEWLVTSHDAHSWPELYFQGYGWLRFEPTPTGPNGQGSATTPGYATTSSGSGSISQPTTGPSAAPSGAPTGLSPNIKRLLQPPGGPAGHAGGGGARAGGGDPWVIFGLTVAGLAVLALIAPVSGRLVVRRRRWRYRAAAGGQSGGNGGTGAAARPGNGESTGSIGDLEGRVRARDLVWAHAAWQELRDDLIDYGAGCPPSESPRAVATRAVNELRLGEPARAALGRIAMAEERARYAARPTDGSGLRADSAAARRAIAAAVPRGDRWRARLLPASVVGPAMSALSTAADALGRFGLGWLGRFRG
jgi:transglutaminase-like putative cysteine protease